MFQKQLIANYLLSIKMLTEIEISKLEVFGTNLFFVLARI